MDRDKLNRMNKASVHWERLLDGMDAIAADYRDEGWETLVLHPGDVSVFVDDEPGSKTGFRLVVPQSELDAVAELVGDAATRYDEFEVYRGDTEGLVLCTVAVKSADDASTILYPVYYDSGTDQRFVESMADGGMVYSEITNLGKSSIFSFVHRNIDPFLP
ncbi:hypothetical protein ACFPYI_16645 [Halomarina salina]|uniref:Uncharacterized protein n=1 Tax=Halomarina salina TaxID=1872699 RepID=A0ABD5RRW0_9EURY|nr:hypothetical protein [Halomarina salina]